MGLKWFTAWWMHQRTEVAALLNWLKHLLMPFKISNNIPVLPTLSNHGLNYYKAMQRAKSKLHLESLYFSLTVKKAPVFHTFHWPWRSDFFAGSKKLFNVIRVLACVLETGFYGALLVNHSYKKLHFIVIIYFIYLSIFIVIIPVNFIQEQVQQYPKDPPTRRNPVKVLILSWDNRHAKAKACV